MFFITYNRWNFNVLFAKNFDMRIYVFHQEKMSSYFFASLDRLSVGCYDTSLLVWWGQVFVSLCQFGQEKLEREDNIAYFTANRKSEEIVNRYRL